MKYKLLFNYRGVTENGIIIDQKLDPKQVIRFCNRNLNSSEMKKIYGITFHTYIDENDSDILILHVISQDDEEYENITLHISNTLNVIPLAEISDNKLSYFVSGIYDPVYLKLNKVQLIKHCDVLTLLQAHFPSKEKYDKDHGFTEILESYILYKIHPDLSLQIIKLFNGISYDSFKYIIKYGCMTIFYQVYIALASLANLRGEKLEFLIKKATEKNCLELLELNKHETVEHDLKNVVVKKDIFLNALSVIPYITAIAIKCDLNKLLIPEDIHSIPIFMALDKITSNKTVIPVKELSKENKDIDSIIFEYAMELLYILGYDTQKIFEMIKHRKGIKSILQHLDTFNKKYNLQITEEYEDYILEAYFRSWTEIFFNYIKYKFSSDCFFVNLNLLWLCETEDTCKIHFRILKKEQKYDYFDCVKNSQRFIIIPLSLKSKIYNTSHLNMLIYDKKLGTLERFEPHGTEIIKIYNTKELDNTIVSVFENLPEIKTSDLKVTAYFTPEHFCPVLGPQTLEIDLPIEKQKIISNTCQIWSIVYAYYRLKYPDLDRTDMLRILVKHLQTQIHPYDFVVKIIRMFNDIQKQLNNHIDNPTMIYENAPDIDALF